MELKYFGKPWLQAFKGAFFILIGVLSMLQVYGSMQTAGYIFSFFIGLTGFVLIAGPIILKTRVNKVWNITLGIINLLFALLILLKLKGERLEIFYVMIVWILFNSFTELVEAGILYFRRNAFFALFIINAMLSLLLSWAFYALTVSFDEQRLYNIGFIAVVFGVVYLLSSYLLQSIKKPE